MRHVQAGRAATSPWYGDRTGRTPDSPGELSMRTATSNHTTSTLTAPLRYEWADAEGRALLGSYLLSLALGTLWLLLVWFGPRAGRLPSLLPDPLPPIGWRTLPELPVLNLPEPDAIAGTRPARRTRAPAGGSSVGGAEIAASAFAGLGSHDPVIVDAAHLLRGVDVSSAPGALSGGAGQKSAIVVDGGGSAGTGRRGARSGEGGGSFDARGSGVGAVRGDGIAHTAVRMTVTAPVPPSGGAPAGDAEAAGAAIRARSATLNFCYAEAGLKTDPALAGRVTLAIDVGADGAVIRAAVAGRSWSGAAAAATEACLVRSAQRWRFAPENAGSYAIALSFTRGLR